MKKVFLFWGSIFVSAICLAGQREDAAIAEAFPGQHVTESSVGNIDGSKYLAALVFDESGQDFSIAVFEDTDTGKYRLSATSKSMARHSRWTETSLNIKNGTLYFSVAGNGGCCSDYFIQYQFRPTHDVITLIGTASYDFGFESKRDKKGTEIKGKYISYKFGSNVNYLNGKVTHYRVQAPSSRRVFKDDIFRLKIGKRRIEKSFNFSAEKKVPLDEFDMFADQSVQPKHVQGFFDQDFNYSE
jgi:hypothetical protein